MGQIRNTGERLRIGGPAARVPTATPRTDGNREPASEMQRGFAPSEAGVELAAVDQAVAVLQMTADQTRLIPWLPKQLLRRCKQHPTPSDDRRV